VKLLLDINIMLDVVLARHPWAEEAAVLLSLVENGRADGYIAGHTITTIHYIVAKEKGSPVLSTGYKRPARVQPVVATLSV
jgi:predicted nucleic acid-binding protein